MSPNTERFSPSIPQCSPKAAVHHEIHFVAIGLWLYKPVRFSDAHHIGQWLYHLACVFSFKRWWTWTWMKLMLRVSVIYWGEGLGLWSFHSEHSNFTLYLIFVSNCTIFNHSRTNCVQSVTAWFHVYIPLSTFILTKVTQLARRFSQHPWRYTTLQPFSSLSVALFFFFFFSLRWYKQKCRRVMKQITERLRGAEEEDDLLLAPVLTIKQPFEKPKSKCQQKIIPTEARLTISLLKPIDAARNTRTDRNVTVKHELDVYLVVFGWYGSVYCMWRAKHKLLQPLSCCPALCCIS